MSEGLIMRVCLEMSQEIILFAISVHSAGTSCSIAYSIAGLIRGLATTVPISTPPKKKRKTYMKILRSVDFDMLC